MTYQRQQSQTVPKLHERWKRECRRHASAEFLALSKEHYPNEENSFFFVACNGGNSFDAKCGEKK
jgi:hypothetical protein